MGSKHTAYRVDDAAQPLKDEHRSPVVIQIVAFGCLDAHGHEGLSFGLCTCQKAKQPRVRREPQLHELR